MAALPDIPAKIMQEGVAKTGVYDIFNDFPYTAPDAAGAKVIVPLDQYAEKYKPDFSGIADGLKFQQYYDGKLYTMVNDGDHLLMVLRKDLVENPQARAEYKAKFGKEPTAYALYAAEGTRVVIEAIKRAGHPGRRAQISADVYLAMLDGSVHGLSEKEIINRLLATQRPEDHPDTEPTAPDTDACDRGGRVPDHPIHQGGEHVEQRFPFARTQRRRRDPLRALRGRLAGDPAAASLVAGAFPAVEDAGPVSGTALQGGVF